MTKLPAKTGRPPIEIDWKLFDALIECQATQEELAQYFQCSVDTIQRHVKIRSGMGFAEYFDHLAVKGRVSWRRAMHRMALKEDRNSIPILIYLDKKYLGGLPIDQAPGHLTQVNVQNVTHPQENQQTIELLEKLLNIKQQDPQSLQMCVGDGEEDAD